MLITQIWWMSKDKNETNVNLSYLDIFNHKLWDIFHPADTYFISIPTPHMWSRPQKKNTHRAKCRRHVHQSGTGLGLIYEKFNTSNWNVSPKPGYRNREPASKHLSWTALTRVSIISIFRRSHAGRHVAVWRVLATRAEWGPVNGISLAGAVDLNSWGSFFTRWAFLLMLLALFVLIREATTVWDKVGLTLFFFSK